jgi:Tfp pilus assembly protein PilF
MNGRLIILLVWLSAASFAGCAGWKQTLQPKTTTETREERAKDAVQDFEERRDAAQLEAALDRWKQGDVGRAEAMLSAVVKRRPEYVAAQMLLAEVLWSRNDASAEQHLRAVIELQPNRADAHHALGLVLNGTERTDEARQHLSKAAELEPANEVYRETSESLAVR